VERSGSPSPWRTAWTKWWDVDPRVEQQFPVSLTNIYTLGGYSLVARGLGWWGEEYMGVIGVIGMSYHHCDLDPDISKRE